MKATGIVRRIDDLGRVVIPKEIRRTMRIREGDPLEIYTDQEGEVILKKYSPVGELNHFAGGYAESAYSVLGGCAIVTDTDQVVAVSGGSRKEFLNKRISPDIEKIIRDKISTLLPDSSTVHPITTEEGTSGYESQVVAPIISQGDAIGSVIFFSRDPNRLLGETELRAAEIGAKFLARQMEN